MGCISKLLEDKVERVHDRAVIEGGGIYKGYEYLITFNDLGFRCGYVAINENHPLYNKKDYDDLDLEMHGGCTFYGRQMTDSNCSDNWIGFDCGHAGDGYDFETLRKYNKKKADILEKIHTDTRSYMKEKFGEIMAHTYPFKDIIRTKEFVEEECKNIIDQLTR